MPRLPRAGRPLTAGLLLIAALAAAACGGPLPTAAPASLASSQGPASPASPGNGAEPLPGGPLLACIGLAAVECAGLVPNVLAALGAAAPAYVEVGPFHCPDGTRGCPATLAARPSGRVTPHPRAAAPAAVRVEIGPGGAVRVLPERHVFALVEPASRPGVGAAAVPFELGHCGLWSPIDFDGSLWVPVGFVDADAPEAINTARGTLHLIAPDRATFSTPKGFRVTLARYRFQRFLPLCD